MIVTGDVVPALTVRVLEHPSYLLVRVDGVLEFASASAVGGHVEAVTGTDDPDAGGWPGTSDVWDEGGGGARGVASHAVIVSADARPSHHIHLADRPHMIKRTDERYRGSG